jgi:hypothetical protein
MAKADLHLHTDFSDGLHPPHRVVKAASQAGLQFIAVTDHDTMEGAFRAKEYSLRRPDLGVQVILAEEVSTLNGHVVGLFLQEFIPARLSARRTVDLIHEQGGIAILAHPFHVYTGKQYRHPKAVDIMDDIPFDGVETINHGDALSFWSNRKAQRIQEKKKWAPIGCSDAHNSQFIGMAYTEFEGSTSEDLKAAILARRTRARYDRSWNLKDVLVHLRDAAPVLSRYSKKMAEVPTA